MNYDRVKEDVVGRWPGIFRSLGIEVGDGRHTACPICREGKDRFRMDDKHGTGSFYCSVCGAGDGWALIQKVLGIDFKEALKSVAEIVGSVPVSKILKSKDFTTPEEFRAMFNGSKIISPGDPAHRYLISRGLTKIPEKLRYHPATWEKETKRNQKAMLAIFMSSANKAITLHRTYLDADGNKLQIEKTKKIMSCLPGERMPGGAIRLFPLDGRNILGIAEGIETAIAAAEMFDMPVWSTTSAIMMEAFVVPAKVEHLHIFGDNDTNYTGQKAAYVLANKVSMQKKVSVTVHIPPTPSDWLDVLNSR